MAKNILVINVDICETRVALIENGIIAELHLERHGARGTLGNVYVGKVSRVLPGMQAAFIDIGQERAAFLHVEDLIRPDDLDAYLSGKRQGTTRATEEDSDDDVAEEEEQPQEQPRQQQQQRRTRGRDRHAPAAPREAVPPVQAVTAAEVVEEDDEDVELVSVRGGVETVPDRSTDDDVEEVDQDEDEDEDEDGAHTDATEADEALDAEEPDVGDADVDEPSAADDDDEPSAADDDDEPAYADDEEDAEADDVEVEAIEVESIAEAFVEPATRDADVEEAEEAEEGEGEEEVAAEADATGAPEGAEQATGEDDAALKAPRARTRRGGRGRRRRGRTKPEGAAAEAAPQPAPREPQPQGRGGRQEPSNERGGRPQQQGRDRQGSDRKQRGKDGRRQDGRRGQAGQSGGRQGNDKRDGRSSAARAKDPLRVSKSTPIRDVVREGQEVIVQVSKEPIGTKGARVTSHISLPGRYVVYLPTVEHVGISKRIGSDKERARLREAIEAMKPPQGGLIVRTLAEGLTKKALKADVGYLVRLWGEIVKKREMTERAPANLYAELDLVLKTARDLFTDDIEKIVIDSREEYVRLRRFVEMFMPDRVSAIELYEGEEPLFDAYGIEDEIGRALSRKVPLSSGGHLIIDQAEALTAIDVNTGRFVGRGSRDLEETILQTNLEAVEEIAYQLRFRNIGGLIILDLIDMERASNREKVRRKLEQLLAKDKAKTTLNRISDLGLIEMTRKRTRESLGRIMNEPCFYCDGTGNLQSRQTIAYEILRQIKRERMSLRGYSVVINAHPAVVDLLRNEERAAVTEAEKRYMRRIELVPKKEYHLEQFDLVGK
ncbi:MAG: Rne/Rng family ribonuclease [Polyangiaceae bacterium]|nr:Rne/Rng family ribonuclease [Polyangiaceae bacterium]